MNLLMIHGNGGAHSRFQLFEEQLQEEHTRLPRLHFPSLPGFEGRPLPVAAPDWAPFLAALQRTIKGREREPWVFYGHGIGGSLLLEWASRGWPTHSGGAAAPRLVVLHGCIGASLQDRFFPRLMKPMLVRRLMQRLIHHSWLQPLWEKKLFRRPSRIPPALRRRFFEDYARCDAFPVFFDLITPAWYEAVRAKTGQMDFHFLWGTRERIVASKYLDYWKRDFPQSTFELVPGWDHFPMLDDPEAFTHKMITLLQIAYE